MELPTTEFSHGDYGDLSGVTFYGPPEDGWFWVDKLQISDRYFRPIVFGVLDRYWRNGSEEAPPRLAMEWNVLEGWADSPDTTPVSIADGIDFVNALAGLEPADIVPHCETSGVEDCLRCASVLRQFITSRLDAGGLFIEQD